MSGRGIDDEFLATVASFTTREIEPLALTIDTEGRLPEGLTERLARLDLFILGAPAELGGCGAGLRVTLGSLAAIGSASPAVGLLLVASHAAAASIEPAVGSGGRVVLGEPVAVVDPGTLTASLSSEQTVVLNGVAPRVEHVALATLLVVVATEAGPGVGGVPGTENVYLLARRALGVSVGPSLATTGLRGADAHPVTLDSAPVGLRLGGPPQVEALRCWQALGIGALAVGVARRAVGEAEAYAAERRQFGRPVNEFPALRAILDRCAEALAVAEADLDAAAGRGETGAGTLGGAARAARRAARAAVAITLDAVQVHGGYGYVAGSPVERLLRDAVSLRALSSHLFLLAAPSESRQLTLSLLPDLTP